MTVAGGSGRGRPVAPGPVSEDATSQADTGVERKGLGGGGSRRSRARGLGSDQDNRQAPSKKGAPSPLKKRCPLPLKKNLSNKLKGFIRSQTFSKINREFPHKGSFFKTGSFKQ